MFFLYIWKQTVSFFLFLFFLFGMCDSKHHKEVSHHKKQKLRARIHELFQRYVR